MIRRGTFAREILCQCKGKIGYCTELAGPSTHRPANGYISHCCNCITNTLLDWQGESSAASAAPTIAIHLTLESLTLLHLVYWWIVFIWCIETDSSLSRTHSEWLSCAAWHLLSGSSCSHSNVCESSCTGVSASPQPWCINDQTLHCVRS